MKRVTIKDIAEKSGVSKATVSRVLNHPEKVDVKTRDQVSSVIKKYNYSPSLLARGLSNSSSNNIGIIIPEIDNPFYGLLLREIMNIVNEKGMTAICFDTGNIAEQDLKALALMTGNRVDGIIYAPSLEYGDVETMNKGIEHLKKIGIPMVLLDRHLPDVPLDYVVYHNKKTVYQATKILIHAGYKDIAFLAGPKKISIGRDRTAGYFQAMKEEGIQVNNKFILKGDFTQKTAYKLSKRLLASGNYPSAIITCNNTSALGYLQAFTELKNPPRIKHLGLDEIKVLETLHIPYNHACRQEKHMATEAFELLLNHMASPQLPLKQIQIEPSFVLDEELYAAATKSQFTVRLTKEHDDNG